MPAHPDEVLWFLSQLSLVEGKWAGKPWVVMPHHESFVRKCFALGEPGGLIIDVVPSGGGYHNFVVEWDEPDKHWGTELNPRPGRPWEPE